MSIELKDLDKLSPEELDELEKDINRQIGLARFKSKVIAGSAEKQTILLDPEIKITLNAIHKTLRAILRRFGGSITDE